MEMFKGLVTSVKQLYNDINPATLTGAIDVIVVERPNGEMVSTPFHVRFGKINVMNFVGKTVEIYINDEPTDLRMKLGASGEAFFVEAIDEEPPSYLATSPLPDSPMVDVNCSPRKRSDSSPAIVRTARTIEHLEAIANEELGQRATKPEENNRLSKMKKRRRKVSKAAVGKPSKESSSSDVEETQFIIEVDDAMSSSEMRTAKTTINPQCSPAVNREEEQRKEPNTENNASNTTVSSDDEFNWNSVASGVASTRLSPSTVGTKVLSEADLSEPEIDGPRPPSPAKSDTAVEIGHMDEEDLGMKWHWGELPQGQLPPPAFEQVSPSIEDESPGVSVDAPKHEDIYLDDLLAQEDPEMRQRYIGSVQKETPSRPIGSRHYEDGESGNGPSLSQSPQSGLDSDCERELRHPIFNYRSRDYSDIAMSLCGYERIDEPAAMAECFLLHQINYDEFCSNLDILNDPNLVFRLGGKYYTWKSIAHQFISLTMFHKPLPEATLQRLNSEGMPKKKVSTTPQAKSRGWWWSRNQEEVLQTESTPSQPIVPIINEPVDLSTKSCEKSTKPVDPAPKSVNFKLEEKPPTETFTPEELLAEQLRLEEELSKCHNKKSLRLSSDQLKSLGLRPGQNLAEFKVITAYQGTSVCSCQIYLWKSTDKVVISDIDGTITKSDVLGHILPMIGKDWAQSGVTSLFNKIHHNGYKMIYLSARAIGQAHTTRSFLRSVKQDNLLLPDGPVLLNPTSLFSALHREVVAKSPHIFKINCLKDVKQLFNYPEGTVATPFYAGFGNKMTDAISYKTVSVPVNRIFTINPRGEISQELLGNIGITYHCLGDIADHIFPPIGKNEEKDDFSSFAYWKEPIPSIELESTTDSAEPQPPQSPKEAKEPTKSPVKPKK